MRRDLVEILACPVTRGRLTLIEEKVEDDDVIEGWLVQEESGHRYRIEEGIPRMLTPELKKELGLEE